MGQRTYEHPDCLSSGHHLHVKRGMYQPTMSASTIPMKSPVVQIRHFLALQKTSPNIPKFFPSLGFWIPKKWWPRTWNSWDRSIRPGLHPRGSVEWWALRDLCRRHLGGVRLNFVGKVVGNHHFWSKYWVNERTKWSFSIANC